MRLADSPAIDQLSKRFGEKIFMEIMQGDEMSDEIDDLMAIFDWLSEDNPDEDMRINTLLTDEVWSRIIAHIVMAVQSTRRT